MLQVERYRFGTHPDCDMRPLSIRVVVQRVKRFFEVNKSAAKALEKTRQNGKGSTKRPPPPQRRGRSRI